MSYKRDCVVRAIATAEDRPYAETLADLQPLEPLTIARHGVHPSIYRAYLAERGWRWTPTMGIGTGCRVHLRADELPRGRLIVRCSRHLVAVIDGAIHDNHDSSRGGMRCVYGYWSR